MIDMEDCINAYLRMARERRRWRCERRALVIASLLTLLLVVASILLP
jgi:hypothetical protein